MKFDKYQTIGADYHYRQIKKWVLRDYNASVHARFLKLVESVRRVSDAKTLKVLDVGCGDGVALFLIQNLFPHLELFGIDEVEEAIDITRQKVPGADLTVANVNALPYENDSFDIVISSDVIEHVETPDKMLNEMRRVAKPGARIIIGTPIRRTKEPIDLHHVQEFFVEDFMNMLAQHFKDLELHESHNLIPTLLYNAPTRSFLNFKYLINLLSWFGYNPFLAERRNRAQMFAYMYIICRK